MNTAQFIQMLHHEGYPDPVEVQQPPNGFLDNHSHPFAVKALVVDGTIEIEVHGNIKTYVVGDIFQLKFEEVHSERYGPTGVLYLASRKQSR